jgi:hypothetical protein
MSFLDNDTTDSAAEFMALSSDACAAPIVPTLKEDKDKSIHFFIMDSLAKVQNDEMKNFYLTNCYAYYGTPRYQVELDSTDFMGTLTAELTARKVPYLGLPQLNMQNIEYTCESCNTRLEIRANSASELICNSCQEITRLPGLDIESNDQVPKGAGHESIAYATSWWYRILGRDGKVVYDRDLILSKVKKELLARGITNKRSLNCDVMRECLAAQNLSTYNYAISYIIRDLTGKCIVDITDEEDKLIIDILSKVVHYYRLICAADKSNNPYCAYFILKIVEQLITDEARRAQIIRLIHVQESHTTKRNDQTWEKIAPLVGLKPCVTNITQYKK